MRHMNSTVKAKDMLEAPFAGDLDLLVAANGRRMEESNNSNTRAFLVIRDQKRLSEQRWIEAFAYEWDI